MKKVVSTHKFESDVRFYKKKKKYIKIQDDLAPILIELENDNLVGDKLEGLDIPENTAAYKVRIANTSANVGKSNGFRLLTKFICFQFIQRKMIFALLTINKLSC